MKFSVLMSVYKNETAKFFLESVESVMGQTVKPDQIVLVRDGQVPEELSKAIDMVLEKYKGVFTFIPLEQNGGLGNALKIGLTECVHPLVARMDTDDICLQDRFEKQLKCFDEDENLDICGGDVAEFYNSPEEIVSYRKVPKTNEEIKKGIKKRNPFNHMTVMFKKEPILNAGGYEPFHLLEDWYLWLRLYLNGCKFKNVDGVLCNMRITGVAARRGGYKYFKSCKKLLKFMRQNKIISWFGYVKACVIRFCGYVLLPNKLRAYLYKKLLRKKSLTT